MAERKEKEEAWLEELLKDAGSSLPTGNMPDVDAILVEMGMAPSAQETAFSEKKKKEPAVKQQDEEKISAAKETAFGVLQENMEKAASTEPEENNQGPQWKFPVKTDDTQHTEQKNPLAEQGESVRKESMADTKEFILEMENLFSESKKESESREKENGSAVPSDREQGADRWQYTQDMAEDDDFKKFFTTPVGDLNKQDVKKEKRGLFGRKKNRQSVQIEEEPRKADIPKPQRQQECAEAAERIQAAVLGNENNGLREQEVKDIRQTKERIAELPENETEKTAGQEPYSEETAEYPQQKSQEITKIDGCSETDESDELDGQDGEIEDYNHISEAQEILNDLKSMKRSLLIRTAITGVLSLGLIWMGLSSMGLLPELFGLSVHNPVPFLLVETILVLLAALVSNRTIVSGIEGFWKEATVDSMVTVSVIGSVLQLVTETFTAENADLTATTLFAPAAVLGLCLTTLGKWVFARSMQQNFELSTMQDEYAAAYPITEIQLTHQVTQGLAQPAPRLLVSRPTALVKGFLKQSFSERHSDRVGKKITLVSLGAGVLCAIIGGIFSGSISVAMTAFAAAVCLGAPLAGTLVMAMPNALMQQAAAQVGAVIPGWSAMEELNQANVVMAQAKDLFPAGSVQFHGLRTFSKERIDLAILYASSILTEGCSTLRDIFLGMIEQNTDMLYPVENLTREIGCGFAGWINHNRVLVGNRQMMDNYGVEIPSVDYEERYTKDGRKVIYLAVSGNLFGMFLVSYHADPQVSQVLEKLMAGGISLLVQSDDFNLTDAVITEVYGLREGTVKVLSAEEDRVLEPSISYLPASEGVMTHIGTFTSFVGGLRAAVAGTAAEKLSSMLLACGAGVGLLLVLLVTVTKGLAALTLPAVLVFQLAWLVLTLIGPLLKQYR